MKFSVIIPVYNKASCISTTLSSVFAQTCTDYEIILVDDGSKDNSVAIIQQFTDARIRLIQQSNAGVSAARNVGIAAAKGEWICFLDADDWWHPSYLEQLSNTIKTHTIAQIVAAGFYCVPDRDGWHPSPWPINQQPHIEIIEDLPNRWLAGIPFFTSSLCAKKTLLLNLQNLFAPNQHRGEDLDVWFRLAEKHSIYLINQPLVAYRTEQSNSLTSNNEMLKPAFVITMLTERINQQQIPKHLIASSLNFVVQDALTRARMALVEDKRWQGFKLLWSARTGWFTKRFIVTLIMLLVFPSRWVANWQNKRSGRQELR